MSITVDLNAVRTQSKDQKTKALQVGFSDFVTAAGAPMTAALAVQGYQPAAVTSAAITAVASTPGALGSNPSNAPYFGTSAAAIPPGGFPVGNGTYNPGFGIPTAGGAPGLYGSGTVGTLAGGGMPGLPGYGAPSQDFMEKQYLFDKMNDANWEMLTAQVLVNNLSRDYQARSNILKTKSDTELSTIRNMRA